MKYTMHSADDLVFFIMLSSAETKSMQEMIDICNTNTIATFDQK